LLPVDPLPLPDAEPDVVPDPALPVDDELDVPVDPPAPDTIAGGVPAVVVVLEAS